MNSKAKENAKRVFLRLGLEGWKISKIPAGSGRGGQAIVFAVEHIDGTMGAFRYLKDKRSVAINRFYRELKILTDPQFQHPNVLKIIEHTQSNTPWYISELGSSFSDYWGQAKRDQNDPEALVNLAIKIILQMLDGLSELHEQDVIHRDIKPNNIIMKSDIECCPVLIDFGLAYVADEEDRLTPLEEAVGNIRYSPDVMMDRMDEINPWLDVFQMSQLLIWMISKRSAKDWKRPRDWRWVNYDKDLSGDLVLSIRALTALCSEETTSPENARELSSLIKELVVFTTLEGPKVKIDYAEIRRGVSKGKSDQSIEIVKDIRIINSSYPQASQVYSRLRDELENIYTDLITDSISVEKEDEIEFGSFHEQLINSSRCRSTTLYRLVFGDQKSQKFKVRVVCLVYRPSLLPYTGDPPLPESSNIFTFGIQRHSSLNDERLPNKLRWLTIERTGEWMLRDEHMANPERTNVNQIGKMIRSWISDEEIWEAIHRGRR